MYKAWGPIIEARNADTTPDPDPTSRHISTLKKQNKINEYSRIKIYITENDAQSTFNVYFSSITHLQIYGNTKEIYKHTNFWQPLCAHVILFNSELFGVCN